ncbi:MAG: hypothetical protein RR701_12140 [Comamonas sp.]
MQKPQPGKGAANPKRQRSLSSVKHLDYRCDAGMALMKRAYPAAHARSHLSKLVDLIADTAY